MKNPLTKKQVDAIVKPGLHWVSDNLYLLIKESGRASWIMRVKFPWERRGKRHDIGLGKYPVVPIAKARKKVMRNLLEIDEGKSPLPEKQTLPTFAAMAKEYYTVKRCELKREVTFKAWVRSIENHAMPFIGHVEVDTITQQDIIKLLKPIWLDKPAIARSVKQRVKEVLDYAQLETPLDENVADDRILKGRGLPKVEVQHESHEAVPVKQAASAYNALDAVSVESGKLALRFMALTASRPGEALGAGWDEINLDDAMWHIPEGRTKGRKAHISPLSAQALDILNQAKAISDGGNLVFPAKKTKGPMRTPTTSGWFQKAIAELGITAKQHGWRSTFADWAVENNIGMDLADLCLSHLVGNQTQQAYFRSTRFPERRALMATWGNYLAGGAE